MASNEITLKLKVEVVDGKAHLIEDVPTLSDLPPRILLICQDTNAALIQERELRRQKRTDVYVAHAGASLHGMRFDTIIRPAYLNGSFGLHDGGAASKRQEVWWQEHALTRLSAGGVVLAI